MPNSPRNFGGPLSSVFQKVTPLKREAIDTELLDSHTMTLRKAYAYFKLAYDGVSYSACVRYARNIRHKYDLLRIAVRAAPQQKRVAGLIPALAAQHLIEALARPKCNLKKLKDLTYIYRFTT